MHNKRQTEIRTTVRNTYAKAAEGSGCCSGPACCTTPDPSTGTRLGYAADALGQLPDGANLGLGCGNPQAIADLKPGETVLDLGCGAGIDCFLAARAVGETGRVIGVDMTPEMITRALHNKRQGGYHNVEFHQANIEQLPVADNSVDVIISNCVINLSPDKGRVFREAYRVLKPGGRLAISDVVAMRPLPDRVKQDTALYTGCVAGAITAEELEQLLRDSGFSAPRIRPRQESREWIDTWAADYPDGGLVVSATIEGIKHEAKADETGQSTG